MKHDTDDPCIVRGEDINDLLERLNILPEEMRGDLIQERLIEAHNSKEHCQFHYACSVIYELHKLVLMNAAIIAEQNVVIGKHQGEVTK